MVRHKKPLPGNPLETIPRRILAGFGPIADEMQTIEAALALAEALRAEIAGHFVEESSLLDYAALPFARIVRPGGKPAVPLELSQMEREFSHAAATWRRTLSMRAERSRVSCTFSTTRGEYCTEIAKAASATDIVVVNPANVAERGRNAVAAIRAAVRGAAVTVLLPAYRPRSRRGPVVLMARDGVPGAETFRLADRMASTSGSGLVVLAVGDAGTALEEIRSAAHAAIDADVRIHRVPGAEISAAVAALGALEPSYVIWPGEQRSLSDAEIADLLRNAKAPLLLMRHTSGPDRP